MRIGLVCPYDVTKGGGVQEGVLALRAELAARGHSVKIITPLPRDADLAAWPDVIFIGAMADIKSPFATTAQVSVSMKTDEIETVLTREKFDILHFHEPWVPIMSRQLLNRSNSINVATFHARLPDTMMSKTVEAVITPYTKPLLKCLDGLTAVSDAAAEYARNLTDQPVEIIPNGINLSKYRVQSTQYGARKLKSHSSKSPLTILYVGRLEKRKGVRYLLKAFQLVLQQHPKAQLVLAGDGPDREKLEQLARQLGLKNIEFRGYVADETKLELLNSADVFCSPALYGESFGIVLLEAMAMGVPTVAGDNPGYRAVLQERGKLSLVDPKNTKAFARRLELFLEDGELRQLWRDWAGSYVQDFDYPKIVDKYEALYRRLRAER